MSRAQAQAVDQAAASHGVPDFILRGVWQIETASGANVATSSAGAEGDFQFLPSTAKLFGYPLTNTPTPPQFVQQADDAAAYLAELFREHGSWEAALRAYSGGGYGLSDVQSAAAKAGAQGGSTPAPAAASGSGGLGGVLSAVETVPALGGVAVVGGGLLVLALGLWAAGGFA